MHVCCYNACSTFLDKVNSLKVFVLTFSEFDVYNNVYSLCFYSFNYFVFNLCNVATLMWGWQVTLFGLDNYLNVGSCVQINSKVRRMLAFRYAYSFNSAENNERLTLVVSGKIWTRIFALPPTVAPHIELLNRQGSV